MREHIAIAVAGCLLCSCASPRTAQRRDVVVRLYTHAALFDPCGATHDLFQADTAFALPVFLKVFRELQSWDKLGHKRSDFRQTMLDRACITLGGDKRAILAVVETGAEDPSPDVRKIAAGCISAYLGQDGLRMLATLAEDPDSGVASLAEQIMAEIQREDPEGAEPAPGHVPSKAAADGAL